MMVRVGWKAWPPRAGGRSGRLPRPGFPPDPGGFKVGRRSLKLRGWSMYTKCSVWCTSGASGLTNSLAMGRRTSKKMTEKCRREDNKMPGTERWYFGQGCEPWRPSAWNGVSVSQIAASPSLNER